MLHITNGDLAVGAIGATGIGGEIVPWRDVLHEGPVPAGLGPVELREVRARYLASEGWGRYDDLLDDLGRRDAVLACAGEHDEIVLWFEDDLCDQLQLLQALDSFAGLPLVAARVSLVSLAGGVGRYDTDALREGFRIRESATRTHHALASRAWEAFRSPDPAAIEEVARAGASPVLPFLHDALIRTLEEYPACRNGLSRTEAQALETIANGAPTLREAFVASHHAREERVFLGDAVFAAIVTRLGRGVRPLVEAADGGGFPAAAGSSGDWDRRLRLTPTGRLVVAGREDAAKINGLNRWVGGVHLHGHDPAWRWDAAERCLRSAPG